MMTKMDFVETVKNEILNYLPEHISAERKVQVVTALKHNDQVKVGITIIGGDDVVSGPNIYLEEAYQDYLEYGDMGGILRDIASIIGNNWQVEIPPVLSSLDFESVKDKIFFTVVDKGRNEKLLLECPHYIDDSGLAFLYSIKVEEYGRAVINNALAEGEKYDTGKLHDIAKGNMQKLFNPTLERLSDAILKIKDNEAVVENLLTAEKPIVDDIMYMLSNDKYFFGANAIFMDGVKEKISEVLGGDFYAIPSSIHEWMILADKGGYEITKLQEMLITGNSQTDPQDILSDDLYRYDHETKKLTKVYAA